MVVWGWGQRPYHLDMKTLCKFPYKFLLCTHSGLNFTMISNKTHMLWQECLGRFPAAWHFCKGLGTLSCTPEGPGKPLLPTSLIGPLVGQRSRVFLGPEAGSAWWHGQKERWPWCIGGAPLGSVYHTMELHSALEISDITNCSPSILNLHSHGLLASSHGCLKISWTQHTQGSSHNLHPQILFLTILVGSRSLPGVLPFFTPTFKVTEFINSPPHFMSATFLLSCHHPKPTQHYLIRFFTCMFDPNRPLFWPKVIHSRWNPISSILLLKTSV